MKRTPAPARIALALTLLALPFAAGAQDFPSRTIRMIVPYAGGGLPDPLTRVIAQSFAATFGQSAIVEQKPGAGGLTAIQELLKAPADGHTLMFVDPSQWAIQPNLRPGAYDPLKDFAPIGIVGRSILYLMVREDLKVANLQELVALAKSKPGVLSYGTPGNGSLHHLFMETLKSHYGVDIVHVPFKGAVLAFQAFMAGDLGVAVQAILTAEPQMKSGTMRRILAGSSQRSRFVPNVPSLSEAGIEGNFAGDLGYIARGGTPKPVVDKLAAALAKAVQNPDFQKQLENFYADPLFRTPEQFAETIRADLPRYARAIKIAGAKATD
jgi:tripartite-type tricarboxylate transporter receptor subunit TctC